MCSAKNTAPVTYSRHANKLPISELSCWRLALPNIRPHFIPLSSFFSVLLLSFTFITSFIFCQNAFILPLNSEYWQIDGWSAERIYGWANRCVEETARVHMCSLERCVLIYVLTYVFFTKWEKKTKIQKNILRKTSQVKFLLTIYLKWIDRQTNKQIFYSYSILLFKPVLSQKHIWNRGGKAWKIILMGC